MTTYVPGTLETDPKKLVMSLQQLGPKMDTTEANVTQNTSDIATNAANIATNTANIATNTSAISGLQTPGIGLAFSGGSLKAALPPLANSIGADVSLNVTANYFDGPSVAQGTSGTWLVTGTVTLTDLTNAQVYCKLWDGTTVIASSDTTIVGGQIQSASLSGFITAPAGNLRISCRDISNTTGFIKANVTGNSKDSTITAIRIA